MPQLDRFAFVPQVLWLITIFLGMYMLLLKNSMPRLLKILSFRKAKLKKIREDVCLYEKENYFLQRSQRVILMPLVNELRNLVDKVVKIVNTNIVEEEKIKNEYLSLVQDIENKLVIDEEEALRKSAILKLVEESEYIEAKESIKKKILGI